MEMRYTHHYPESLRSGIEAMDRVENQVITNSAQLQKKGVTDNVRICNPSIFMVGQGRIELPTLGFSGKTLEFQNLLILI